MWKNSIHCTIHGAPLLLHLFEDDWFCPNLVKEKSALGKTFPSINSVMREEERKVLTIRTLHPSKNSLFKIWLGKKKLQISWIHKILRTKRFIMIIILTKIRGFPCWLYEGNVIQFSWFWNSFNQDFHPLTSWLEGANISSNILCTLTR